MTLRFDAGFDVTAFGTLRISDGATDADVTGGRLCHLNLGSVIPGSYSVLSNAINSAMTGAGINAVVAYLSTGRYRIAAGASPINITAGVDEADASHARMGQVLGFSTSPGSIAAGNSVTGDIVPYFMIEAAMGGASDATDDYEGGSSEAMEAEDGTSYGVAPTSAPRYSDFTVAFEPRAAVYARAAVASAPWTWEHFYQHCRVVHPFAVTDDFGEGVTVHKLMPSSDRLKPKRVVRDYRELHDLKMKTRVLGRI